MEEHAAVSDFQRLFLSRNCVHAVKGKVELG